MIVVEDLGRMAFLSLLNSDRGSEFLAARDHTSFSSTIGYMVTELRLGRRRMVLSDVLLRLRQLGISIDSCCFLLLFWYGMEVEREVIPRVGLGVEGGRR